MASDEKKSCDSEVLAFEALMRTIRTLRAPGGCPWDREQTPASLRTPLIEEAFEAVDAINEGSAEHAKEELGDVLLNALMIAEIFSEQGDFSVEECLSALNEKLIRRHPHVFGGGAHFSSGEEVLAKWDEIKATSEHRAQKRLLDEVPKGFPPLLRAYKIQKKAAKKGFDYADAKSSLENFFGEMKELSEALESGDEREIEAEAGDTIFALVNYLRKCKVDPSLALSEANEKFYRRFSFVEEKMGEQNIPMDREHLAAMDDLWAKAKAAEKNKELSDE